MDHNPNPNPSPSPIQSEEPILEYYDLKKRKKSELQDLCKKYSHKVTGTKSILIDRLLGKEIKTPLKKKHKKRE